jgi:hypothetical protein
MEMSKAKADHAIRCMQDTRLEIAGDALKFRFSDGSIMGMLIEEGDRKLDGIEHYEKALRYIEWLTAQGIMSTTENQRIDKRIMGRVKSKKLKKERGRNEGLFEQAKTKKVSDYMQTVGHGNCGSPAGDCDDQCNTCTSKTMGEFERVYQDNSRSINLFDDDNYTERVIVHNNMIKEFFTAHNADIAAKDKRIAELSKAVADWQEVHAKCLDKMEFDKKAQETSSELLQSMNTERAKNLNRIDVLQSNDASLRSVIRELEAQVPTLELFVELYNSGYASGHHDTVEGMFTDIHPTDKRTYHASEVLEIMTELMEGV